MEEDPFYVHDIHTENITDLKREVSDLDAHKGRLLGVVSDEQGGIIAYAIGEDNANRIVDALNNTREHNEKS